MFVNYLLWTLVFVVFSSPPLLSLFLLRRPSFARVLLHVATTFYPLLILAMTAAHFPVDCYAGNVLLVVSGATFVAGLPEAAAGMWARLVYYAALLFWLFLVVMFFTS
jgi:hypothetical protein